MPTKSLQDELREAEARVQQLQAQIATQSAQPVKLALVSALKGLRTYSSQEIELEPATYYLKIEASLGYTLTTDCDGEVHTDALQELIGSSYFGIDSLYAAV